MRSGASGTTRRPRGSRAAILGILITAAAIFGSFYKVPSPTLLAPWAAVIWGVIGLLYMLPVKGREPASDALADLRS